MAGPSPSERVAALADRPIRALDVLQTRLGGELHSALRAAAAAGAGGLVLSDTACPGLADAFGSHDGSSDYLRGYLTPVGSEALADLASTSPGDDPAGEDFARSVRAGVSRRLHDHELPGEVYVGVHGSLHGTTSAVVRVVVADLAGPVTTELVTVPAATGDSSLPARQRLAGIAALLTLGAVLERRGVPGVARLTAALEDDGGDDRPSGADEIGALAELNRQAWDVVRAALPVPTRLSVGESFTLGRLARLCCSRRGYDRVVNYADGWYHPAYKQAIGVSPDLLTDERIAEPPTVEAAARGLIRHAPGATTLAVATSGWANNDWLPDLDGTVQDFFAVAVAGRVPDDPRRVTGETLRCSVTATAGRRLALDRRQRTRELGVTAGLLLLLRRSGPSSERDASLGRLERALGSFGTWRVEPTSGSLPPGPA